METGNFNKMMYRHDCVFNIINAPYKDYPLNLTGLLDAIDEVLIYSEEESERHKANQLRKQCTRIMGIPALF